MKAVLHTVDLDRIAALVHEAAGIVITEEKSAMVQARLSPRLRATGTKAFGEYIDFVTSDAGRDERGPFIRALTTNLTRFYREPHHFTDFREKLLPSLLPRLKKGGKVRIWSSACSTGEEPYSIAFDILRTIPDAAKYDIRVLATDIDSDVVAQAKQGRYAERIVKNVPDDLRNSFFTAAGAGAAREHCVVQAAKDLITFRELNLLHPWPVKGPFDAIFCRNVMIYFNRDTQEMLLERFAALVNDHARLYLGHSERVTGKAQARFENTGMTTYIARA
ncbi:MAG: protein-glutamate O-methyltransferase [Pseudomonadota bacterium]